MSCRVTGTSVLVVFTACEEWAFLARCSGGEGLSYMASDHLKSTPIGHGRCQDNKWESLELSVSHLQHSTIQSVTEPTQIQGGIKALPLDIRTVKSHYRRTKRNITSKTSSKSPHSSEQGSCRYNHNDITSTHVLLGCYKTKPRPGLSTQSIL